jgi:hypothetical protein
MFKLYTVYDSKAAWYRQPFYARTRGEAIRAFEEAANDKQTQVGLHPEDFVLYEVGAFDDLTGQIDGSDHTSLGKAVDYIKRESPNPTQIAQLHEERN